VAFKDRKTAESFYSGLNGKTLPGQEETLTLTWVPNGTPSIAAAANGDGAGESGAVEPGQKSELEEDGQEGHDAAEEMEEGEIQGEMDYEVADEADWAV
jgi:hypothetical protein